MAENSYDTQVNIDVETNIEPSIKLLKELKKQLKETAAGSEDFKKLSKSIKDVEDALEEAKAGAKGFVDQLEDAPGVVGQIAGAFRKLEIATKSFGTAFKAVGIGLIVGLVAGLAAAFSKSEDAVKKFEPLLIGMEKILNGLLEALQPLIDGFIQLATDALPYVSKAFQVVYSAVTAVFQSIGKLGSSIVKLFKGDFKGAWADAKESVTGFSTNYDSAVQRFEAGTKKMTKTQKENLKEQNKDLEDAAAKAKQIREQEQKELLDGQKEAFLELLSEREQEEYKVNQHYATLLYLATKYGDDTIQLKLAQQNALDEIDAKYKAKEDEKKLKEDEDKKKKDDEFAKYQMDQFEKIKKLNQDRADSEFAANQAIGQSWVDLGSNIANVVSGLNSVFEQGSTAQKIFGVAQIAINAAASIGQILLNKAAGNAEFNKTIATGEAAILSALPKLFNPVTAPLGIAEAAAGKAAIAGAVAGKVKLGLNSALQIGVVGATSAAQIAAVLAAKKSSAGAGSGGGASSGGAGTASIATPTIAGTAAPVIGGTQSATPGAQIAQTLSGATGKPIEAYVVSGKISSQQALDRRTSVAATFGGY
jgi:hypothetical protein